MADAWLETWDRVMREPSYVFRNEIDVAFDRLALNALGSAGGSHDMMAELNRAREQGMKARGGGNAQG